jgi:hypothetical protein
MVHYHPDYEPNEQALNDKKAKRRHAKLIGGEQETGSNTAVAITADDIQEQSEAYDQNGDAVRMPLLCLITIAQILSGHGKLHY